jgi:hypothetical protein
VVVAMAVRTAAIAANAAARAVNAEAVVIADGYATAHVPRSL